MTPTIPKLSFEPQPNGLYRVKLAMEMEEAGPQVVENVLFLTLFGSHLHGTTTPSSDLDLKAIFIADFDDIVLQRDPATINLSTGGQDKNTKDDVDVEFLELRKFLDDAMKGQTYAVELLHASKEATVFTSELFEELRSHKGRLLTANVKPFIGYCVSQAKKYGLKGSRLKATEEALRFFESQAPHVRVEDVVEKLEKNEYVFLLDKSLADQEEPVQLLEINTKQFDMRNKVKDVVAVLRSLIEKYGGRAHRAKEGVDWKAVGHAYRCIYELEELLTTGEITFPLKERERLKAVKLGQVDYDVVQEELPALIERVETLKTTLPDEADRHFWENWTLMTYRTILGCQ